MMEHITTLVIAIFASSGFWAFLTAMIQKPQVKEVISEVSKVDKKVDSLSNVMEKTNADNSRTRILRFDDEIYNGETRHSQEYFIQMLSEIDVYEDYCRNHPDYSNNRAIEAIKNIKTAYQKCRDEHSFI